MKRTKVKFEDVRIGDTLYIEGTGTEYGKCDKRTCTVVGISNKSEILYVDFGEGFCGHSADNNVPANTGYNLWKQDQQQYFTLFKVEEKQEEVPETKYTYSGKILKHLKVGDIFFLDKFPDNSSLEGMFYEVTFKYTNSDYGFDFKEVTNESRRVLPSHTAGGYSDVRSKHMVITLTRPLGKTKEDKIAKLEAKLERITNELKTLKESGE